MEMYPLYFLRRGSSTPASTPSMAMTSNGRGIPVFCMPMVLPLTGVGLGAGGLEITFKPVVELLLFITGSYVEE